MNKAFEKILKKIEEKRNKYQRLADSSNFDGWNEDDIKYSAKAEMCEELKQIVQEVAEEYNGGWIACSERLPKEDGSYLVQSVFEEEFHFYDQYYDSGCEAFGTYRDYYDENTLGFLDSEFVKDEDVIAWQPLPEPFKERD